MTLYWLALIGVGVFAVSGALAAGRKEFDWVGVILVAIVTALGGGTLRDVLLNRDRVFWISDPTYIWVTLAAAGLTLVYTRRFRPPLRFLLIADALGLALFSISGAQVAESYAVAPIIVVLMGTITGVFGGVLRDILVNDIPLLCKPTEPIYSTTAVAGIIVYLLFSRSGTPADISMLIGVVTIAVTRIAGIVWNIRLPAYRLE